MIAKTWTTNSIKDAVRATGSHWYDPDTMRFFGTVVLPEVYQGPGGVYFVTQDNNWDRKAFFTVRQFDPAGPSIETVGEVAGWKKKAQAEAEAERLAGEGAETAAEEFQPVSVLEQFVKDLRTHGSSVAAPGSARELIRLAGRHHRQCEHECNGTGTRSKRTEAAILSLALSLGAAGVVFSGDPRGCTVKLAFKDGATNDFGREGWCVPTSEKPGDE